MVESVINGKRRLHLTQKKETYETHSPILQYRLFPKPNIAWVGNVNIKCQETGLEAELSFKSDSFLRFGGSNRTIKGKIIDTSSSKKLFDIHGQWDRIVYIKDTTDGTTRVMYNAKETISSLPTPILKDPKGVWESESARVWAEVSKAIINKEWHKARDEKSFVEEQQRKLVSQRKSLGEVWVPKYFYLSHTPEYGWDCSPKQNTVPQAPIIFPI